MLRDVLVSHFKNTYERRVRADTGSDTNITRHLSIRLVFLSYPHSLAGEESIHQTSDNSLSSSTSVGIGTDKCIQGKRQLVTGRYRELALGDGVRGDILPTNRHESCQAAYSFLLAKLLNLVQQIKKPIAKRGRVWS